MQAEQIATKPISGNKEQLSPFFGWLAIGALIILSVVGIFGAPKIMNYLYPASTFAVSLFLYHRYPLLFHGLLWWIFFLTPLIRRIVDYRSSFTNPSPILLAPVLAMLVFLPSLIKYFPRAHRDGLVPFAVSAAAVGYGFIIGCINHVPASKLIVGCMGWLSPILYGFFIFINWRRYPEYKRNFEQTLLWGILIMGIYGIYQYFALPAWDSTWLINAEFNVAGNPAPQEIRVWSTMNSGEPFSAVMSAGLILILGTRGLLFTASSVAGYIAFLLTLVRTGWLAWASGIFVLFATSRPRFQLRLILSAVFLASLIVPLVMTNSFAEGILTRFSTFSNLEEDASANSRQSAYAGIESALGNLLGGGFADLRLDSSIFSLLGELGWIGGIPYLFGLVGLIFTCWKTSQWFTDSSSRLFFATAVTCLVRVPVNNSLVGVSGMILWGCLAFFLAGAKYTYHQQPTDESN